MPDIRFDVDINPKIGKIQNLTEIQNIEKTIQSISEKMQITLTFGVDKSSLQTIKRTVKEINDAFSNFNKMTSSGGASMPAYNQLKKGLSYAVGDSPTFTTKSKIPAISGTLDEKLSTIRNIISNVINKDFKHISDEALRSQMQDRYLKQISDGLSKSKRVLFDSVLKDIKGISASNLGGKVDIRAAFDEYQKITENMDQISKEMKKSRVSKKRKLELQEEYETISGRREQLSNMVFGQTGVQLSNVYTGNKPDTKAAESLNKQLNLKQKEYESALRESQSQKSIADRERKNVDRIQKARTTKEKNSTFASGLQEGQLFVNPHMMEHGTGLSTFTGIIEEGGKKFVEGIEVTSKRKTKMALEDVANPENYKIKKESEALYGSTVNMGGVLYGVTQKQRTDRIKSSIPSQDEDVRKTQLLDKHKSALDSASEAESRAIDTANKLKTELDALTTSAAAATKAVADVRGKTHISDVINKERSLSTESTADVVPSSGKSDRVARLKALLEYGMDDVIRREYKDADKIIETSKSRTAKAGLNAMDDPALRKWGIYGVKSSGGVYGGGGGGAPPGGGPPNKPPNDDFFNNSASSARKLLAATKEVSGAFDGFKKHFEQKLSNLGYYSAAATVVYSLSSAIRQLYRETMEYERVIIESTRLFGSSRAETRAFADSISQLGAAYSVNLIDAAKSATVFAQQGFTMGQTLDLVGASLAMSKVGSMDASKATEYLTAAMAQFEIPASKSMDIVDKFTTIANKHAVTIDDLGQSMMRAGGSARVFGVSMTELAGMTAAIQTVTRRGGNVIGTSLNFMMGRMFSEESVKAISSIGVKTRESNGALRDATGVLRDLADKWGTLSAAQQRSIGFAVAGQRQFSQFAALMMNWREGVDAVSEANDSLGSTQEQLSRVMESSSAKMTSAWSKLQGAATKILGPLTAQVSSMSEVFTGAFNLSGGAQLGLGVGGALLGTSYGLGKYFTGDETSQAQIKTYNMMKAQGYSKQNIYDAFKEKDILSPGQIALGGNQIEKFMGRIDLKSQIADIFGRITTAAKYSIGAVMLAPLVRGLAESIFDAFNKSAFTSAQENVKAGKVGSAVEFSKLANKRNIVGGITGGATMGLGAGASIGSQFGGPWGALIGGAAGGIGGGILGYYNAKSQNDEQNYQAYTSEREMAKNARSMIATSNQTIIEKIKSKSLGDTSQKDFVETLQQQLDIVRTQIEARVPDANKASAIISQYLSAVWSGRIDQIQSVQKQIDEIIAKQEEDSLKEQLKIALEKGDDSKIKEVYGKLSTSVMGQLSKKTYKSSNDMIKSREEAMGEIGVSTGQVAGAKERMMQVVRDQREGRATSEQVNAAREDFLRAQEENKKISRATNTMFTSQYGRENEKFNTGFNNQTLIDEFYKNAKGRLKQEQLDISKPENLMGSNIVSKNEKGKDSIYTIMGVVGDQVAMANKKGDIIWKPLKDIGNAIKLTFSDPMWEANRGFMERVAKFIRYDQYLKPIKDSISGIFDVIGEANQELADRMKGTRAFVTNQAPVSDMFKNFQEFSNLNTMQFNAQSTEFTQGKQITTESLAESGRGGWSPDEVKDKAKVAQQIVQSQAEMVKDMISNIKGYTNIVISDFDNLQVFPSAVSNAAENFAESMDAMANSIANIPDKGAKAVAALTFVTQIQNQYFKNQSKYFDLMIESYNITKKNIQEANRVAEGNARINLSAGYMNKSDFERQNIKRYENELNISESQREKLKKSSKDYTINQQLEITRQQEIINKAKSQGGLNYSSEELARKSSLEKIVQDLETDRKRYNDPNSLSDESNRNDIDKQISRYKGELQGIENEKTQRSSIISTAQDTINKTNNSIQEVSKKSLDERILTAQQELSIVEKIRDAYANMLTDTIEKFEGIKSTMSELFYLPERERKKQMALANRARTLNSALDSGQLNEQQRQTAMMALGRIMRTGGKGLENTMMMGMTEEQKTQFQRERLPGIYGMGIQGSGYNQKPNRREAFLQNRAQNILDTTYSDANREKLLKDVENAKSAIKEGGDGTYDSSKMGKLKQAEKVLAKFDAEKYKTQLNSKGGGIYNEQKIAQENIDKARYNSLRSQGKTESKEKELSDLNEKKRKNIESSMANIIKANETIAKQIEKLSDFSKSGAELLGRVDSIVQQMTKLSVTYNGAVNITGQVTGTINPSIIESIVSQVNAKVNNIPNEKQSTNKPDTQSQLENPQAAQATMNGVKTRTPQTKQDMSTDWQDVFMDGAAGGAMF